MKKIALFSSMFLLAFGSIAQQTKTYHGVNFSTEFQLGNENLVINGAGLREKYFMDLYVAALFIKKKSTDATKIITANEDMAIHLKIVSNSVTRERFIESVNAGFAKANLGKATKEEIKKFVAYFSAAIKSGDRINLDFVPEKGVKVTINGDLKGTIPGLEFKKALFSIWLGSEPAQESLRDEMLGKE